MLYTRPQVMCSMKRQVKLKQINNQQTDDADTDTALWFLFLCVFVFIFLHSQRHA